MLRKSLTHHLPLLSEIPPESKENTSLKTVNLEKNRLTHIPDTVNEWVKLEYLNVASNRVESFPEDLTGWSNELKEVRIPFKHFAISTTH